MKTIVFRSWTIVLSIIMPFLLIISGCGNLHKLKTSDLHQRESSQESTVVLQESGIESLHTVESVFQLDSSDYWIWFQSSDPFIFHPDKGLEAEQGGLVMGGSRFGSNLVQENTLQLSSSKKDAAVYENLETTEKSVVKELEKERKDSDRLWLWLLGGGLLLWFVFKNRAEDHRNRRLL